MEGRFGGEGRFSEMARYSRDKDPRIEIKAHLDEINKLLAKLIEKGGDLPSNIKKTLRAQMQAHAQALGIKGIADLKGLMAVYQKLDESQTNLPVPSDYPTKAEFREKMMDVYRLQGRERLPAIPKRIKASDVAKFGQGNWKDVKGRGQVETADYLYNLGAVMCSKLAYETVFGETDSILVGEGWNIENGRHRAITLRVLGESYVEKKGMNDWVRVGREK